MRLDAHEFIRRFLLHVLPDGFHRIRHYGLFANASRADNIAKARELLGVAPAPSDENITPPTSADPTPCPCCGGRMILVETFERAASLRTWPPAPPLHDTS